MKKEELANYIRESVAGAARLLWLGEPTQMMQDALKCEAGMSIVEGQGMRHLRESNPVSYSRISRPVYASVVTIRRRVANAARILYVERGTDSGWLIGAHRSQIIDCAEVFGEKARTYTLEDMHKAYMAAWKASGEGYNGEHGPFVGEGTPWAVERDEALARI